MTTRKTLAALEKVQAAEANGALPYRSDAEIFKVLCEEELLTVMASCGGGAAVIGYRLTDAGRAMVARK